MAWFSKYCVLAILCVLLICCQSSSEKVAEVSPTANVSIEFLYSSIHQNRLKNEALADNAGKLYAVTKDAYAYLELLKQRLDTKDTAVVGIALPGKPLIGSATADTLSQKLLSVYNQAYTALSDQQKVASLDSALLIVKEIRTNQQWASKYFDQTPTIAAITVLNKFQYDCLDAARIALSDIKQHLEIE